MATTSGGLKAWFLVSGCIGLMIALVLTLIPFNHKPSPTLILTLWPPAIAGIADPTTLSDKILVGTFEFGGNFLLYGIVGTVLGIAFRLGSRTTSTKPN